MAQGQRWAAMGEDQLPQPVWQCGGTGGGDTHLAEHTMALPTLTRSIMATTGTSTAHGAAATLLPCPSNKHSTGSNTNQIRKGGLCFPPLCCFLLFSSAF